MLAITMLPIGIKHLPPLSEGSFSGLVSYNDLGEPKSMAVKTSGNSGMTTAKKGSTTDKDRLHSSNSNVASLSVYICAGCTLVGFS